MECAHRSAPLRELDTRLGANAQEGPSPYPLPGVPGEGKTAKLLFANRFFNNFVAHHALLGHGLEEDSELMAVVQGLFADDAAADGDPVFLGVDVNRIALIHLALVENAIVRLV